MQIRYSLTDNCDYLNYLYAPRFNLVNAEHSIFNDELVVSYDLRDLKCLKNYNLDHEKIVLNIIESIKLLDPNLHVKITLENIFVGAGLTIYYVERFYSTDLVDYVILLKTLLIKLKIKKKLKRDLLNVLTLEKMRAIIIKHIQKPIIQKSRVKKQIYIWVLVGSLVFIGNQNILNQLEALLAYQSQDYFSCKTSLNKNIINISQLDTIKSKCQVLDLAVISDYHVTLIELIDNKQYFEQVILNIFEQDYKNADKYLSLINDPDTSLLVKTIETKYLESKKVLTQKETRRLNEYLNAKD